MTTEETTPLMHPITDQSSSPMLHLLGPALAKAQIELENATKSSKNEHFRSSYADLAAILEAARETYAKHGLSLVQLLSTTFDDSGVLVHCRSVLLHSSGQWIASTLSIRPAKPDAQGIGAAATYARRYGAAAIYNLAQEDDDGETAVGRGSSKTPAEAPPPRKVPSLDDFPPPAPGDISETILHEIEGHLEATQADDLDGLDIGIKVPDTFPPVRAWAFSPIFVGKTNPLAGRLAGTLLGLEEESKSTLDLIRIANVAKDMARKEQAVPPAGIAACILIALLKRRWASKQPA